MVVFHSRSLSARMRIYIFLWLCTVHDFAYSYSVSKTEIFAHWNVLLRASDCDIAIHSIFLQFHIVCTSLIPPPLFVEKNEKKNDFCVEINSWNWKSTMNFKFIFMMHFCIVYLIANEWRHGNNVPLDDWQWEKVAHKKSKLFGYNLLSGPQKARFDVQTERQRDKQTPDYSHTYSK